MKILNYFCLAETMLGGYDISKIESHFNIKDAEMKQRPTLMEETKYLLLNRPVSVSIKMIAEKVGKTTQWVNKFAKGDISDPSVNAIEKMNIYLKSVMINVK